MKLKGRYSLRLWRKGRLWLLDEGHNLVVSSGKVLFATIVETNDGTSPSPSHLALGSGGAELNDSQTDLQGTEHKRAAAVVTRNSNELQYSASFAHSGATITVREGGVFNDPTAGTMIARFLMQEFNLTDGDSVELDWTLPFG